MIGWAQRLRSELLDCIGERRRERRARDFMRGFAAGMRWREER